MTVLEILVVVPVQVLIRIIRGRRHVEEDTGVLHVGDMRSLSMDSCHGPDMYLGKSVGMTDGKTGQSFVVDERRESYMEGRRSRLIL